MRPIEYDIMASVEEDYWWYTGLRRLVVRNLPHGPVPDNPQHILDLGCGTGGCYRAIRGRFPTACYVGLDLAPAALHYCRHRGLPMLIRASVNQVPLLRAWADVIVCLDVLCEISVCPSMVLQQCYELLRPGGLLLINLPAFESLRGQHDAAVGIRKRFRAGEARALMEQHGFHLRSVTYWNMMLFFPMLLWRWQSRRSRRTEPRSDLTRLPKWLNTVLSIPLWGEVLATRWVSLPFGSSIFLVGQKPW